LLCASCSSSSDIDELKLARKGSPIRGGFRYRIIAQQSNVKDRHWTIPTLDGLNLTRSQLILIAPSARLTACHKSACRATLIFRHGSNAHDSSSPPARSGPVILSAAKDLAAARDRPSLRGGVTRGDCSCTLTK
jgi:hypothetical protein